jgi:hypothetical protein
MGKWKRLKQRVRWLEEKVQTLIDGEVRVDKLMEYAETTLEAYRGLRESIDAISDGRKKKPRVDKAGRKPRRKATMGMRRATT